jgi:hypothetical protein
MDGKGVEKLVCDKVCVLRTAHESLDPGRPAEAISEARPESLGLSGAVAFLRLHDQKMGRISQRTAGLQQALMHILHQLAVVGTLLDQGEIGRFSEGFPSLHNGGCQEFAEERPDAHRGVEVPLPTDASRPPRIVTSRG